MDSPSSWSFLFSDFFIQLYRSCCTPETVAREHGSCSQVKTRVLIPARQSISGRAVLLLEESWNQGEQSCSCSMLVGQCWSGGSAQEGERELNPGVTSADPRSTVVARLCFLQSSFLKVLNGAEQGSSACVRPRHWHLCAQGRSCWWQGRRGRCWRDGRCSKGFYRDIFVKRVC